MSKLHTVSFILIAVGGINWLLVGLFGWDVGEIFGGQGAVVSKIIYILVGLATIAELVSHKKLCRMCVSNSSGSSGTPAQTM
jgi:uncharacterized membrane protein YuzA (DUF378 family)